MTDKKLGIYKGHDVLNAAVQIRNTGDGLSEAMGVDPVELELDATVHVVLECTVEKHRYDPIKDGAGALTLVNMLKAGRATIIEGELLAAIRGALDEQEKAIAEAKGEPQLDLTADHDHGLEPEDEFLAGVSEDAAG
jgi:hypothetical protein